MFKVALKIAIIINYKIVNYRLLIIKKIITEVLNTLDKYYGTKNNIFLI